MAKKFKFDPNSLNFKDEDKKRKKLKFILTQLLFIGLISIGVFVLLSLVFDNKKEKELKQTNEEITENYNNLYQIYTQNENNIKELEKQDNELYQVMFGTAPPTSNIDKFLSELETKKPFELSKNNSKELELLFEQMNNSKLTFDSLLNSLELTADLIENIPAIQPVPNLNLTLLVYGYGQRLDPIYHTLSFHAGIDYGAPIGTPVLATANGKIAFAGYGKKEHGITVEINHGDYSTVYQHLSEIKTRKGKKVERGEIIGYVGTSGKATVPHLHYEVKYKGKHVNPIFFFFMDLSSEQFAELYKQSTIAGISLD